MTFTVFYVYFLLIYIKSNNTILRKYLILTNMTNEIRIPYSTLTVQQSPQYIALRVYNRALEFHKCFECSLGIHFLLTNILSFFTLVYNNICLQTKCDLYPFFIPTYKYSFLQCSFWHIVISALPAHADPFPNWLLQLLGADIVEEMNQHDEPHFYCQGDGLGNVWLDKLVIMYMVKQKNDHSPHAWCLVFRWSKEDYFS